MAGVLWSGWGSLALRLFWPVGGCPRVSARENSGCRLHGPSPKALIGVKAKGLRSIQLGKTPRARARIGREMGGCYPICKARKRIV